MSLSTIKKYVRFANYLSAAQIYLKDNFLLEKPLSVEHIKPRLLGHWGTVPGQNFIYANLNYLIKKHDLDMLYISGPGHGFPAVQSNLFLEGTLSKFYKEIPRNKKGMEIVIEKFSWPYGFPSHAHPGAPGTILEGGELGYSLSTAYGAVMDNPNLILACCIGDGEAETGPLATAWQSNKFINPNRDGTVLPILHLNGYKIAGPTIFNVMSDGELQNYFEGLGYDPEFVEFGKRGFLFKKDIYKQMQSALEIAIKKIKNIKQKYKDGKPSRIKWPMIILKTPKGWTGVDHVRGNKIEGTWRSHQVEVPNCKEDPYELKLLSDWLKSYKIEKLLDEKGNPIRELDKIIPRQGRRMGDNIHSMCSVSNLTSRQELKFPDIKKISVDFKLRGNTENSSMRKAGEYLKEVFRLNSRKHNFRLFCPDETDSNKLGAVFQETERMMMWPFDKSINPKMSTTGRVLEMLSEHTQVGWLQGYLLTGRHGVFVSYESFTPIVSSMVDQFAKFLKQSREYKWRKPISSMTFILSSLGWRQDHNGFSHQNPGFISSLLEKFGDMVSVYMPADANSMLVTLEDCLKRTNSINIIVAGKTPERQWLSLDEAYIQHKEGIKIWNFLSDKNPDIVLASAGDYPTQEMISSIGYLKRKIPEIKIRYVNVSELTALGLGDERIEMDQKKFDDIFTKNKPIIFNFHGYPGAIKKLFFDRIYDPARLIVNGYEEEGSTTTPFDMLVRNGISRYQISSQVAYEIMKTKPKLKKKCLDLMKRNSEKLEDHKKYIIKHGDDPEFIKKIDFMQLVCDRTKCKL